MLSITDNRAAHAGIDDKNFGTDKGYGSGTTTGTTAWTNNTTGPHESSIVNKLDHRVDPDATRDVPLTATHGAKSGIAGSGTTHTGTTPGTQAFGGATASHGSTLASGTNGSTQPPTGATPHDSSSTNAGPHSSNIADNANSRLDSDRDHYARHETVPGGVGLGSTYHTTSTNAGPHGSNIANKLDPRVDSNPDPPAIHQSISGAGAGTTTQGPQTHDTEIG
jgi:hypothetical protein